MRLTSRILYLFSVPFLLSEMISNINRQKKFIKETIDPLLEETAATNDGSIDDDDLKKLKGYYGLAVPGLLGEAFCLLRNYSMTPAERVASTCQGAMTGLGDDFFDKQRLSPGEVKEFIETPEKFNGNSASEKLFLHFYRTALQNAPSAEKVKQQIMRVFQAQMLSKQQKGSDISYDMMKDISISKGAESLLFYRTAFEHPLKPGEEKMLYSMGGLMQLSNDIFDVYEDYQDGIRTLATTATSIAKLRTLYAALLFLGIEAAYRSGYPKYFVTKFLGIISVGIFSRCYVCLDQLERNEKKSNGVFNPKLYRRKDLICDMDTVGNKLRSVKYHLKISRQFR